MACRRRRSAEPVRCRLIPAPDRAPARSKKFRRRRVRHGGARGRRHRSFAPALRPPDRRHGRQPRLRARDGVRGVPAHHLGLRRALLFLSAVEVRRRRPRVVPGGYHSSETLLAFVARGVHVLFAGPALFDIRLMGAIHAVLFLLALAGLIRACRDLDAGRAGRRGGPAGVLLHGRRLRGPLQLVLQPDGVASLSAPDGGDRGGGGPARAALRGVAPRLLRRRAPLRRLETSGEAGGAAPRPLRPAARGSGVAARCLATGLATGSCLARGRSGRVFRLVRAPHALHASRSDALPVRVR